MSGTEHEAHGAAYGSGVYTADDLRQSIAYAASSQARTAVGGGSADASVVLIAACCLVPNPAFVRVEPGVRYNIVSDMACLRMKFVLVYGSEPGAFA